MRSHERRPRRLGDGRRLPRHPRRLRLL